MQLPIFEFHFIHLWIWPQTGSKLSLDTRLVNYYLPEVNIEGKYTCHVQEWPRNKLPNMVLADFTYKIWPEPISVVQIVNVFQHWPLNDPYFYKKLWTLWAHSQKRPYADSRVTDNLLGLKPGPLLSLTMASYCA